MQTTTDLETVILWQSYATHDAPGGTRTALGATPAAAHAAAGHPPAHAPYVRARRVTLWDHAHPLGVYAQAAGTDRELAWAALGWLRRAARTAAEERAWRHLLAARYASAWRALQT